MYTGQGVREAIAAAGIPPLPLLSLRFIVNFEGNNTQSGQPFVLTYVLHERHVATSEAIDGAIRGLVFEPPTLTHQTVRTPASSPCYCCFSIALLT